MKLGTSNSKAQSAMEYLMTYGWAILIIAVVLAALYSLNVFSAGSSLGGGNPCIGQPGFSCSAAFLSASAGNVVQFTLIPALGYTAYNVIFTCQSSSNSIGVSSLSTYNSINSAGTALGPSITPGANPAPSNSITSGQTYQITGVQCALGPGQTLSPIGSSFTGAIWMGYTTIQNTGPTQYVKIAQVALKSSS